MGLLFACLTACSVSGVFDKGDLSAEEGVGAAGLPAVPSLPEAQNSGKATSEASKVAANLDPRSSSEKFNQSTHESFKLASGPEAASDKLQAFFGQDADDDQKLVAANPSLKPYLGPWILKESRGESRLKKLGGYLGLGQECKLLLEAASSDFGHKASGSSECPTGFFMLDSWSTYSGKIVLRDHMGDEILQLTSRGTGLWVGVDKKGATYIMEKPKS